MHDYWDVQELCSMGRLNLSVAKKLQPDNLPHIQVVLDTGSIQIPHTTLTLLGDWTFVSSFKLGFSF